jgi:hypothetical protein
MLAISPSHKTAAFPPTAQSADGRESGGRKLQPKWTPQRQVEAQQRAEEAAAGRLGFEFAINQLRAASEAEWPR